MAISKRCHQVFTKLALKLSEQEYKETTQLMYELYMGIGGNEYDCSVVGMLADIEIAKKDASELRNKMKGKTFKLIKNENI